MKLFHIISTAVIACLSLLLGVLAVINVSNARDVQATCPNSGVVNENGKWHCVATKGN